MTATAPPTLLLGGELRLARVGFGAMRLVGRGWGAPRDPAEAKRVLRRAVELGVNFIDTADAYGPETNELLIRDALGPYRADVVIATKGGYLREGPYRLVPDGRPEHLRRACERSLRRLGLESLPLYQLHTFDPSVPVEDTAGALAELRAEGKVRHVGLCNVGPRTLERVERIVPVASVQSRYNLVERSAAPVLAACEDRGIAFIPWFPLAKGALARGGRRLARVARNHGASPAQVALAWLLSHSPATLPIPGTTSIEHLEENVAAAALTLSPEELAALDGYGLPAYAARRFAKSAARPALRRLRGARS